MKKLSLSVIALLAVAACAKTPSSIAPVAVASAEYDGYSCKSLYTEYQNVGTKLEEAEEKQRAAVAGDAAGVFLVLIPPSALFGDSEAEVAQYKGEKIAIERAMAQKGCTTTTS